MCNALYRQGQAASHSRITFTADGMQLAGTLYLPPVPDVNRIVIGCHGLLSNRTSPKQASLARRCNDHGIAYLAFDHRGCGESDGDFLAVTTLAGRCRDLMAAVAWVRNNIDRNLDICLFGSSLGGTVCLAKAGDIQPAAVVTLAAPIRSATLTISRQNMEDTGDFNLSFYKDNLQFDISDRIAAVDHLLVVHGDADVTVPVFHGEEIHHLAGVPKKIIIQKKGDHRLSLPAHQAQFMSAAVNWLSRAQ